MESVDLSETAQTITENSSESKADRVLRKLESGETVPLKTQSKFGEKLLIGLNISEPSVPDEIFENAYRSRMKKKISVVVFTEGNDTLYTSDEFAVVGHRDIVVGQDSQDRLIAYTDYKTKDYLPQNENMRKKINSKSVSDMNDGNSIQRTTADQRYIDLLTNVLKQKKEEKRAESISQLFTKYGDPYKIGLGEIMQAIAINYLIRNGVLDIIRNIHIQESATKLWEEFGVKADENNNGKIDVVVATPKVNEIINNNF